MKRNKRINDIRKHQTRPLSLVEVLTGALVLPVLSGASFASPPDSRTEPAMDTEIITGNAILQPIDQSGIGAQIRFVDDGTTLKVTGRAKGLDPRESYVTLIYDNGSVPGGPNACQPTIFDPSDPDFLLLTMFVGFWTIDKEGNGKLEAINTNGGLDFVPLSKFRNTSVRLVVGPPPDGSVIPMTKLVACGRVVRSARRFITGNAILRPIDQSGIGAQIRFVDDGTTLKVTGRAKGLDPRESYVTLIYDNGSVPGGPNACQPTIFDPSDPDFLLLTMFVGFWTVDKEGNGKLEAINTNGGLDFVPLSKFRNTSVRLVVGPPPDGSVIPMTKLVACGRVATPRLGRRDAVSIKVTSSH